MNTEQPLEYDRYFHIYNRGINSCNLYEKDYNYEFFLKQYSEYINPIAKTYVWCLMKNHFHLLVKVLPENEIDFIKPKENDKRVFKEKKKYNPTKQFSHLFDSYAKKFNYQNDRTGKLFETPFRRILIDSEDYFRHLVYYIHYNPVKHGFTASPEEYSWSSYNDFLSVTDTNQQYSEVLKWFSSKQEFIQFHKNKFDDEIFKNLI